MQPVVDAAAKLYVKGCAGSTVNVQGGGSGTGLTQVATGAVNIGNSDVTAEEKLKPEQSSTLVNHIVLKQGWVMVVNAAVTGITTLTTAQASDIWTGKTTNWKDVGGPDQAIVLILRPASSGTRATFKKIVLGGKDEATTATLTEDSNGTVAKAVGTTPGSTSVIGLAYYQSNKAGITPLQLDGVDATPANITNGTYKLQANGNMYTKGAASGLSQAFIDYMLSPQVQGTLIPSLYYAPIQ
jgi:phosphate transport system substrate-binding protein